MLCWLPLWIIFFLTALHFFICLQFFDDVMFAQAMWKGHIAKVTLPGLAGGEGLREFVMDRKMKIVRQEGAALGAVWCSRLPCSKSCGCEKLVSGWPLVLFSHTHFYLVCSGLPILVAQTVSVRALRRNLFAVFLNKSKMRNRKRRKMGSMREGGGKERKGKGWKGHRDRRDRGGNKGRGRREGAKLSLRSNWDCNNAMQHSSVQNHFFQI